MAEKDMVNHPPHYAAASSGQVECIDAIRAALGEEGYAAFCRGSVLKYLWRGPHKGSEYEDYQKAQWYLKRLIAFAE
jgi:hypothetical protein